MRILIIEDEKPAAEKLRLALQKARPQAEIVGTLGSVEAASAWLNANPLPNLIFMDIELSDGPSFQLFDSFAITCPVIFITAFDEYWQEAFECNSIDYLLKPLRSEKLEASLSKYETLKQHFVQNLPQLLQGQNNAGYKKRFLVKKGADYASIKTVDIAYFYATHKLVCLVDRQKQKFILDQSLSEIEKQLDPGFFFRVNRKYLVQLDAIRKIKAQPKSKLLLELEPEATEEVLVSQETVSSFKDWMSQ